MTKRQFVVLAFRLFAVYSALTILNGLPMTIRLAFSPLTEGIVQVLASLFFSLAVPAWIIYVLWSRSEWLMAKMFETPSLGDSVANEQAGSPHDEPATQADEVVDYYEEPVSPETIERTVIGLIGLWLIASSLPYFLYRLLELVAYESAATTRPLRIAESLITQVGEILIGLWLTLRPWRLQEVLWRLRSGGLSKHSESDPPAN